MQSDQRLAIQGNVGVVMFGTPNGRVVQSQRGISVPHKEEWVCVTPPALEFDLNIDTFVMQRIDLEDKRVFWFGVYQKAFGILDPRDGGYIGYGVWTVNCCIDGAALIQVLTVAAKMLRHKCATNGKFHTSILGLTFDGDQVSYNAMKATLKPLVDAPLIAAVSQQPVVLDMRGCSDAVCANIIDTYQSELGIHAGEAIALVRSDDALSSAARRNIWPIMSLIDWMVALGQKDAGASRKLLQLKEGYIGKLTDELASAKQEVRTLEVVRFQFLETQKLVESLKEKARDLESNLADIRSKQKNDIDLNPQIEKIVEKNVENLSPILNNKIAEFLESAIQNHSKPGLDYLETVLSKLENLETVLSNLENQCQQLIDKQYPFWNQEPSVLPRKEAVIEPNNEENPRDPIPKPPTPMWPSWLFFKSVVACVMKRKNFFSLRVSAVIGSFFVVFLIVVLLRGVDNQSTIKNLHSSFENEKSRYEREISDLSSRESLLKQKLETAQVSEQKALDDLEKLKAKVRAAIAPRPKVSDPAMKDSGSQPAQDHNGNVNQSGKKKEKGNPG